LCLLLGGRAVSGPALLVLYQHYFHLTRLTAAPAAGGGEAVVVPEPVVGAAVGCAEGMTFTRQRVARHSYLIRTVSTAFFSGSKLTWRDGEYSSRP